MSRRGTRSQPFMPKVTAHLSISLDGYVAGPHQTREEPLGVGGEDLHLWHLGRTDDDADRAMTARVLAPRGAYVMGRNMYAPDRGDWADAAGGEMWRGWWGEDPPYHAPVFVLTHHPHDPVEMDGGTTFHFVTSFDEAMERAFAAAGDDTVTIAGGASAVRQGFEAGAGRRDPAQPRADRAGRRRVSVRRPRRPAAASGRGARVAVRDARGLRTALS